MTSVFDHLKKTIEDLQAIGGRDFNVSFEGTAKVNDSTTIEESIEIVSATIDFSLFPITPLSSIIVNFEPNKV